MTRSTAWFLLITCLLGLAASTYMGLWSIWASATPAWDTHGEAITNRYYLSLAIGLASVVGIVSGVIGIKRSQST